MDAVIIKFREKDPWERNLCWRPFYRCFCQKRIVLVVDPSSTYAETATYSAANCSTYDNTTDIFAWDFLNHFRSLSAA